MYSPLKWPSCSSFIKLINNLENNDVDSLVTKNESTNENYIFVSSSQYDEIPGCVNGK